MDILAQNLTALQQHRPALYQLIAAHPYRPVGRVKPTKSGWPTLRFDPEATPAPLLAYPSDNPWDDVAGHLKSVHAEFDGLVVFIGIGLGYGPLLVAQKAPRVARIALVEPCLDMFCTALRQLDLRPLLAAAKVDFFIGDIDWRQFETTVKPTATFKDIYLLKQDPSFSWQPDLYQTARQQAFTLINQLSVAGGTTKVFGRKFMRNRLANLTLVNHSHPAEILQDKFKNIPAVVVSSGPSLNQNMAALKKAQGRCLLIAADGALAPLLEAGVMPDLVTSVDIKALTFEKFAPYVDQSWPFSLVTIFKVTPLVPKRFAARHLFFAAEKDITQNWFNRALAMHHTIPTSSSVVHLSLGLALLCGADPVVFVGQDMAYAPDTQHAKGVINARFDFAKEIQWGLGVNQTNKVQTDRGFIEVKSRIEDIIRAHPRTYINTSGMGLHIDGTRTQPLLEAVAHHMPKPVAVRGPIDQCVQASPGFDAVRLHQVCQETLRAMDIAQNALQADRQRTDRLAVRLAPLIEQNAPVNGLAQLPPDIATDFQYFTTPNETVEQFVDLWEQTAELVFEGNIENDRRKHANEHKRAQGFLPWLTGELDRLQFVFRTRENAVRQYRPMFTQLCDYLQAEMRLKALAADESTSSKIHRDLLQTYTDAGNYCPAQKLIDTLPADAPTSAPLHLQRGLVRAGLLDFATAAQSWQTAVELDATLAPKIQELRQTLALFWAGKIETFGAERPALCRKWLHRTLALAQDDAKVTGFLKDLWTRDAAKTGELLDTGRIADAGRMLESWEALSSALPDWAAWAARQQYHEGNRESAVHHLKAALVHFPEDGRLLALMARMLIETGQIGDGLTWLQRAVDQDPATATLWEEIGDALSAAGDHPAAATAYENCFAALPEKSDLLLKIGAAHLHCQNPAAAQTAFNTLLRINPRHPVAQDGLQAAVDMETQLKNAPPAAE